VSAKWALSWASCACRCAYWRFLFVEVVFIEVTEEGREKDCFEFMFRSIVLAGLSLKECPGRRNARKKVTILGRSRIEGAREPGRIV
jgi:hypothetical protein